VVARRVLAADLVLETLVAAGSPVAAIDLLGAPGEAIGLAGCLERLALARAHLALDAAE
jgi:hypothetical protein